MASRTYTRTLLHKDLRKVEINLYIYKECKYDEEVTEMKKVTYKGVIEWTIVEGGIEAQEIENETDASGIDEYHEYLILKFEDGSKATFRNSHVDMFI